MKLSYLDLMTTDPSYNLAMEQYVFDCLPRDRMYFMLWQNDNAIIVGKYQNTIAEINEEAVRERGIRVVRRLSGGGAVYHDMGNLNFTFITDVGESNALDLKLFCEPVVRTLATLGVKAEVNGRNDITIDGKKFSGNSQYLRQGRVMHHGTIMFDSDLSVVGEALRVDPTKIQTKGIRSVRSRVTNVAEHLPERFTLINREEDLGIDGLRQSKLSYHPAVIQHKFTAIHLHPDEIACKELWTAAFGDDEQFIDSFLIRYYSRSRMLTAEYEGRTAAMLHLLPFESQLGRTTYIYGVATAPEFRRRGLAGKLMGEAMRLIADRGDDAALLIPSEEWLRGFYAPYGFSGAIPVTFASPDGFDFGTGDPSKDLAMVWRRDASAPMPETLQCSYYKKK